MYFNVGGADTKEQFKEGCDIRGYSKKRLMKIGTAMVDSKHNSNDLFVGTETGYILKVGVNKISQIGDDGKNVNLTCRFSSI
jgi:hypothetical protein